MADVEQDDFSGIAAAVDRQGRMTSDLASKVESHEDQFKEIETILSTLSSEQNSKQENELILSYLAFKLRMFNPCGESDQLIVHLNFAKNGLAKRSKKREAKLRVKNQKIEIF